MLTAVTRHTRAGRLQTMTITTFFATESWRCMSSSSAGKDSTSSPSNTRSSFYSPVKTLRIARLPTGQTVKIFRPPRIILRTPEVTQTSEEAHQAQELQLAIPGHERSRRESALPNLLYDAISSPETATKPQKRRLVSSPSAALDSHSNGLFPTLLPILRHSARDLGYEMVPDGFVRISDVLQYEGFRNFTFKSFVNNCLADDHERFEVVSLPDLVNGRLQDVWWVRARGGHTIPGVETTNRRILNMSKLQTVVYRASPEEWLQIQNHGIRGGPNRLIRLHHRGEHNFFLNLIPRHSVFVCITIDAEKAAAMGVQFYHTKEVELYAIGDRNGQIPAAAIRSVVELEMSKESLSWT